MRTTLSFLLLNVLPLTLSGAGIRTYIPEPVTFSYLALPLVEAPQPFTTATRFPHPVGELLVSSHLFLLEDMASPDVGGLGRALDHLPQFVALGGGYFGERTGFAFSGLDPLVIQDGLPVVEMAFGKFALPSLSLVPVRRVEILREGASSLYGSRAGGGVVNLITKSFSGGKPYSRIGLATGTHDTQLTQIEFGRGVGERLGLYLTWDWAKTGGFRENSDSDSKCLTADLRYSVRKNLRVRLRGERADVAQGIPESDTLQRRTGSGNRVFSELQVGGSSLRFYGLDRRVEYESPTSTSSLRDYGFSLTTPVNLSRHLLLVGTDGRAEAIEGERTGSHTRKDLGLFLQGEMHLSPLLLLLPSLRSDLASGQVSPKLSIAYRPTLDFHLFSSAGRSFRSPTLQELYLSADPDSSGNPDLEVETVLHSDLGFGYQREELSLRGTLFLRKLDNRIGWRRVEEEWTPRNHGISWCRGFELSLEKDLGLGISAGGATCMQRIEGERLPWTPQLKSSFWIGYEGEFRKGNFKPSLRLAGQWVGERFSEENPLDPYLLIYVRGELRLIDLSLFCHFDNLLEETYELAPGQPLPGRTIPFQPTPGRTLSFGLTWEFWD